MALVCVSRWNFLQPDHCRQLSVGGLLRVLSHPAETHELGFLRKSSSRIVECFPAKSDSDNVEPGGVGDPVRCCWNPAGRALGRHGTRFVVAGFPPRRFCSTSKSKSTVKRSATYFYDLLGVTQNATTVQIKDAFYRLSKRYHPDINHSTDAAEKFNAISEAYEILGNIRQRRLYDRGLSRDSRFNQPSYSSEGPFTYTEKFKKRAKAYPTGQSRIYNFDEFYRKHYSDSINKSSEVKFSQKKDMESEVDIKHLKRINGAFALVSAVAFILWNLTSWKRMNRK